MTQTIRNKKQLLKFLDEEYSGKKAINKDRIPKHHTKSKGRQYYSAVQSKAVLSGS